MNLFSREEIESTRFCFSILQLFGFCLDLDLVLVVVLFKVLCVIDI